MKGSDGHTPRMEILRPEQPEPRQLTENHHQPLSHTWPRLPLPGTRTWKPHFEEVNSNLSSLFNNTSFLPKRFRG